MTALAAAPLMPLRPVPWTRLAWVTWRRYRATLAGVTGVLAALAAYLVVSGERMHSAYATLSACRPAHSARCAFAYQTFHDTYSQPGILGVVLLFLPGIVGAFAGAPVLARELETGTFRYAWTQGAGRMRWAIAATIPGAVGVAAIIGIFGLLVTWYNTPLYDSGLTPRLHATVFPITGIAAAGWALAGFSLGALAGLLWRRVLPALATAFAVWFGLAFLAANQLRAHYRAPLTTASLQLPGSDLSLNQWWARHGARVPADRINHILQAVGFQQSGSSGKVTVQPGSAPSIDPVHYLLRRGYTQITSYQPDSRYWPFQWIEFGWLTALSAALLAVTLWTLRRRPA